MCGITGIVSTSDFIPTDAYLTSLRDSMMHRGPDNGTNWFNPSGKVGFGHRRLAIVDLAPTANQPFVARDGQVALVFNGEIYNHGMLRAELVAEGVNDWQTSHSDTEVILQAYRHWGFEKTLSKLRGMFAFAVWDEAQQMLYCARDRAGEKPFYYTQTADGKFIFGSEIKAILADPDVPCAVDTEAMFHYLSFLMVPPPRTLFAGIQKLPAAHYLALYPDGTCSTHRYWDALEASSSYAKNHTLPAVNDEQGWVDHLRGILKHSVQICQESADVPVGVFLSGGIDSSTIAALAWENFIQNGADCSALKTFAIGPDGAYPSWPDETPYAQVMADHLGSTHHTERLTEEAALAFLPTFIRVQDEPVADPSSIPLAFVAQAAHRAGLKVVQGGEGGDELFVGYEDWLKFEKLTRWNQWPLPRWCKKVLYNLLVRTGRGNRFYTEYLRRAGCGQPLFWGGAEAFTNWEKHRLLSPELRAQFRGRTSYEVVAPVWKAYQHQVQSSGDVSSRTMMGSVGKTFWNWCTYIELHFRLPEQLLMRADKMTMASSLEMRVPLLDHVLISAVLASPPELRAPQGDKKHLLKKIVKDLVPKEIIQRKKQGLGMPLNEWILSTYGAFARKTLEDFCNHTGLLDWPAIEELFAQRRGQHIWYLLNLALWHRYFIEQKAIEIDSACAT